MRALCRTSSYLAERVGFEPTSPLRSYSLSRRALSTTQTSLHDDFIQYAPSVRTVRMRRKKSFSILAHSSSKMPDVMFGVWFQRPGVSNPTFDSMAPPFGSAAPYTKWLTRESIIAPAHIGQGSSVTYSEQPVNRQRFNRRLASWSAMSSAWAVPSRQDSRLLKPAPTTVSSKTTTAPIGTSFALCAWAA